MMTAAPFRVSPKVFAGLLLMLASCASPVAVAPEPTVPVVSGKMTRGVITAIRPLADTAQIQTGLHGVLAALNETQSVPAANATEYVVQRSDDISVSIVTSRGGFSMGDQVEIIDGSPPELLHAN